MTLKLELQIACDEIEHIPSQHDFEVWVKAALNEDMNSELTIRMVGKEESQSLNAAFRDQHKPTNVLSFPFEALPNQEISYLGDIAICAPVVVEEAIAQHKSIQSHWAHLTVHGVLHLLGYDHVENKEAEEMEALEVEILKKLGFRNPY